MLIPCDTCHNDPDTCECCFFCREADCDCGPCDMCPPERRRFHKSQKDNLCDECLMCKTCKHSTMYWDTYDEAWECHKCNDEWEEYDLKEMIEHPEHNERKDIPKHIKYFVWNSVLGKEKEAKCFSCGIVSMHPPKFCLLQKGGEFLPICVQCSKANSFSSSPPESP